MEESINLMIEQIEKGEVHIDKEEADQARENLKSMLNEDQMKRLNAALDKAVQN